MPGSGLGHPFQYLGGTGDADKTKHTHILWSKLYLELRLQLKRAVKLDEIGSKKKLLRDKQSITPSPTPHHYAATAESPIIH